MLCYLSYRTHPAAHQASEKVNTKGTGGYRYCGVTVLAVHFNLVPVPYRSRTQ
jgi:hypothetical protein